MHYMYIYINYLSIRINYTKLIFVHILQDKCYKIILAVVINNNKTDEYRSRKRVAQ